MSCIHDELGSEDGDIYLIRGGAYRGVDCGVDCRAGYGVDTLFDGWILCTSWPPSFSKLAMRPDLGKWRIGAKCFFLM